MSNRRTLEEQDPMAAKVISIFESRKARERPPKYNEAELAYRARIIGMDKLTLLQEMVNFQEERAQTGELTVDMMIRGKYLFNQLEIRAETEELRILARSYRRHLEHELAVASGELR